MELFSLEDVSYICNITYILNYNFLSVRAQ
jgi:hypothetical protein